MFRRFSIALLAAAVWTPCGFAQGHGGLGSTVSISRGGFARGPTGASAPRRIFLGSPFFYPDYDSSQIGAIENGAPQIVVVQPPAPAVPEKPGTGPLLIEWRGDRYVRFGDLEKADEMESQRQADYSAKPSVSNAAEPSPAVLIYRDGHRDEIAHYAIADGVIYADDNYWQSGTWTKHIALASLDLAATLQANRQRGVTFTLPSAPNVVVATF